ncbi:glutamate 5-kinase [Coprinopsis cinerea okayama7|uniref:Glutamate 5-kinase n=1 Tax=Coprinopsis cinerea (strain Okayama-7 / 130 / ATCC MYA-4618 / FGSC 9003) TaxID=240176 RepID=A8PA24_COPC7|nr:glutamate 5-kinase [Coprinopsis cinerea okayama7\|eukprot:XP_001839886.1 glutamate 5-kinase [Coprinopsis cinerea okayama7\
MSQDLGLMARSKHGPPCTIVIKLGTSSIVHETTHQPLLSTLASVVEVVVRLRSFGHKVVLVSSGAIGVGLQRMSLPRRPKGLAKKQALAAIGQGRLIALWDNLFGQFEQPIAQVLLTRGDISDRTRYLNAVNTLKELLSMGVVPIVNENDTVSVSEIKFGDNDTLSAITSSMIHADYLFLLTDVDGLYTSNPRKDPDAKQIEEVKSISEIRAQVSTSTLGSSLGTGGMETKLIAAEIASAAGVTTIITSSKKPENVLGIVDYHNRYTLLRKFSSRPSSPTVAGSGRASPESQPGSGSASPVPLPRPPHTVFIASSTPLRDLKSWTSHTLYPAGSVVIDAGAHHVLSKRQSGGRLLPAGVVGVIGAFASGQAVRITVRKGKEGDKEVEEEKQRYVNSYDTSRPTTPASGLQSSAASSSDDHDHPPAKGVHFEEDTEEQISEDDVIEVGRGLANFNSAQVSRVKGLKSSQLSVVLGYADSEYVVENITIRIPPSQLATLGQTASP